MYRDLRMAATDTPLQRLARLELDMDPADWVIRERAADRTWQDIANELADRIGVHVSRETVRLWTVAEATP